MNAIDLIRAERQHQVEQEGWTEVHDDQHDNMEMATAAACYAVAATGLDNYVVDGEYGEDAWPWHKDTDKREKHDRLRCLVIAGALIVAEIERLQRAQVVTFAQDGD